MTVSDDSAAELRRLPKSLQERARAVLDGSYTPVVPRDAATVVLLRDTHQGIEAYVLRRLTSLTFAGGMYVFPGGSVDPRDGDLEVGWHGPPPEEWAPALDADISLARALVCAAVRETFEEAGVLLAGPDGASMVAPGSDPERWAKEQTGLLDRSSSMVDVLARNGLVLRADLLRPWAHWMTPEVEHKRFDTRFFVAALPEGQTPLAHAGEADHALWIRPQDAVAAHATGELMMLPPTVFTLAEIGAYDSVADVLEAANARDIRRVLPKIVVTGDEITLLLPGEPGYAREGALDGPADG